MSSQSNVALHPESKAYLDLKNSMPPVDYDTLAPSAARQASMDEYAKFGGSVPFDGSREELSVPLPSPAADGTCAVPCWVYRPAVASARPSPSICVYIHGGGWVLSSRLVYDVACKVLATRGECVVVSVEYRLAPEHKSPACYEDAEAVVRWVQQNKVLLSGSSSSVVGVAGDSAGGNIAASICHTVRDGIAFQVLIYPVTDARYSQPFTYPSYSEFYTGYALSVPYMLWFVRQFLSTDNERDDPTVSPLLQKTFVGLPPAFVLVAMCDPLRDEGLAYATKLEDSGVPVELMKLDGTIHGFVNRPRAFPDTFHKAMEAIGMFVKKF